MSSITYNGHDFSPYTTCEVIEGPHAVVPTSQVIPGRAGALLLVGRIAPRTIRVRLFLDSHAALDMAGLSNLRHLLYSGLTARGQAAAPRLARGRMLRVAVRQRSRTTSTSRASTTCRTRRAPTRRS
nr:MAG TPA: distal tail protein [Caudoviricetes sp.]